MLVSLKGAKAGLECDGMNDAEVGLELVLAVLLGLLVLKVVGVLEGKFK